MGREEFGKEVHVYAPAYTQAEVESLTGIADHIYFNSPEQIARFLPIVKRKPGIEIGIRVNPGYSNATLGGALYDPCAPYSRFGTVKGELDQLPWDAIDIFHVHALCESLHDGSVKLIEHVAREFAPYLKRVKAVNFGGGHFINKPGYDVCGADRGHQDVSRGVQCRGHPGAGCGARGRYRLSGGQRHRHPPQREGHPHPRCVGELPHAGRAGGALPAADPGRR